jgi:glutamyl-Q tRNA(Asp) synthetase
MGLAPHSEEAGAPYPGICRNKLPAERRQRMLEERFAWRLDMAAALKHLDQPINWQDGEGHSHAVRYHLRDDIVIARKDIGVSYHLAVVVDDAEQGITHVIRGEDLKDSTSIHRLLQALLGLPAPIYIHHPLLRDMEGERLAKRHGAPTLRSLREAKIDPQALAHYLLDKCQGVWEPEKTLGKPFQ